MTRLLANLFLMTRTAWFQSGWTIALAVAAVACNPSSATPTTEHGEDESTRGNPEGSSSGGVDESDAGPQNGSSDGGTASEDDDDDDGPEDGETSAPGSTTESDPTPATSDDDDGEETSVDPSGSESGEPPAQDVYINEDAHVAADRNEFGIVGDWTAVSDGVTSTQTGNPYRDGAYCITGEASSAGDPSTRWGAGLRLDLNAVDGEPQPYEHVGKINGFLIKLAGSSPTPPRLHLDHDEDAEVSPFTEMVYDFATQYWIAEAGVPLSWTTADAGERIMERPLRSLRIVAPGGESDGPIDLCVTEFEPILEPAYTGPVGDPHAFINAEGVIEASSNEPGIAGPVYVFGDGNSTNQTGNPYRDGKYCIAGQFTGATSSWGVGIAFDVNNPSGNNRQPLAHRGVVDGFRIRLSGHTPGGVRIQFLVNNPEQGEQPFLVGALDRTMHYFADRAQVPATWSSSNAGRTVGDSFYAVRVYLEGTAGSGPFEVCVEEFLPGTAAQLSAPAQPGADGFHGVRTIDPRILEDEYQTWKSRHFRDCNDGTACIPRDEGDCISEGVAYGMLLAAGYDDREAFDKLWAYFQRHLNANGVMNWRTNACGSTISTGSASDGELDAAMALIQASCKWDEAYKADALELIDAIRQSEVTSCGDRTVLKPGDNFGGCNQANPSYFAPAYYKAFLDLTGDETWTDLIDDDYVWMETMQARQGGLVPDWADADGNPEAGSRGQYGPDASRTPWRIATDYVWNDEPRAVTFLDNLSAYVDGNGGVGRMFAPNSNFRGAMSMSALHQDPSKAQTYANDWLTTSTDDGTYFPGTLRPIYMLLAAHRFDKSCY